MAKQPSKKNSKVVAVDVKAAQANDKPETVVAAPEAPAPKPLAKNASPVAKGLHYHKLAGSPSKPAVVAVFGSAGYAKSWTQRAKELECTPEELCAMFVKNPNEVKVVWTDRMESRLIVKDVPAQD